MKNVLFITHFFPPINNSGIYRPLKFAKYLAVNGKWNPIVLTINPDTITDPPIDNIFLKDIANLEIYKVNSLKPNDNVPNNYKKNYHEAQLPDTEYGSIMHYVLKGMEIINNQKVDLIYCTIPPYSVGIVGSILKDITNLPLVVDYRDGWTVGNEINKFRTKEGKMINTYFERHLIEQANEIIVADEELKHSIEKKFSCSDIRVIHNGYDIEDFRDVNIYPKKHNIVWCGQIYKEYAPYFKKIIEAIQRVNIEMEVDFIIAGRGIERIQDYLDYPFVKVVGQVSYKESIALYKNATINLLINSMSMGGTSKIYNLIAAGRPIFSLVNDQNKFIKEFLKNYCNNHEVGISTPTDKVVEILKELLMEKEYSHDSVLKTYSQYSRKEQVSHLEQIFEEVFLGRRK